MARFNPNKASDRVRLNKSVKHAQGNLRDFKEEQQNNLEMFVGHRYGKKGTRKRQYLPLMYEAVMVHARHLAARNPTCLVVSDRPQLQGVAGDMQLALNHQLREIDFGRTLQLVVIEAMFSMGIAKMGVTPNQEHEVRGYLHDANQTFVDHVQFENFFYDPTATTLESSDFIGDQYQLPTDYIKDNKMFNRRSRHKAQATDKDGEFDNDSIKAKSLSQRGAMEVTPLKPKTWVYDVWLPGDNLLVTMLKDHPSAQPLRVVEWEGPERGPYHTLGFTNVPGNVQPLAPATLWMDLHELANQLARKVAMQAKNQKKVAMSEDGDDLQAILATDDGGSTTVERLDSVIEREFGGVNGNTVSFLQGVREMFSRSAGNLDILGGLAGQTDTLGQDRILNANANERVRDMQDQVVLYIQRIINEMAWYLWDDPLVSIPITKDVGGYPIEDVWTPASREGDFFDYNFKVEPHSLRSMSPGERLLQLQSTMGNFLMPVMDAFAAQGMGLDAEAYLELVSDYSGLPELKRVIAPLEGEYQQKGTPNTGDHRYIRENRAQGQPPQDGAAQAFANVSNVTLIVRVTINVATRWYYRVYKCQNGDLFGLTGKRWRLPTPPN